jgi:hypothetical protein
MRRTAYGYGFQTCGNLIGNLGATGKNEGEGARPKRSSEKLAVLWNGVGDNTVGSGLIKIGRRQMEDERIGGWATFGLEDLLDCGGEKAESPKAVDRLCWESD